MANKKEKDTKPIEEDDPGECQLVCIAKIKSYDPPPMSMPSKPRPPQTDDSDDVILVKIERIRPPTVTESQLKLPPKIAESFFKSTENPVDDPLEVNKTFSCTQCKRIFSSGQHLVVHMKIHKPKTQRKPSVKAKKPTDSGDFFTCSYCQMIFEKQVSLAAHMNVHRNRVPKKPVNCRECGEQFHSNGSLWNHRKNVHKHELHKCAICCKTFATKTAYDDHLRRHEEQGAIMCDICGKTFTMQNTLKIHMRIHTGERPFLCSDCGKSFTTNIRLQEHIRRHKGQRRHSCPVCSKQFYEKTELKKHSYIHVSEKPHVCDICGKGFVFPASMRQHRRVHSGDKPYKCDFDENCQRHFTNLSQMKRHVRGVHKGEKPYTCKICSKAFLDKQNLEGHIKRIHSVKGDVHECQEEGCFLEFRTMKELNEHHQSLHLGSILT